jgi:hypothetical protein
MGKGLSYAVLGRGQWASKIRAMLESEERQIQWIEETRGEAPELVAALRASGAQAAWLCVTPGPHVAGMVEACIEAGMHVIAEKPWIASPEETQRLLASARDSGILIAIDFEYCLLDEIQAWRARFRETDGLRFEGRFHTSQPDRLHIPALDNLGSHLFAIRRYAVLHADIGDISCAYANRDERRVSIESETVDFTHNRQPILQRFVRTFEAAVEGADLELNLKLALAVAEDAATYRGRQTAPSQAP